MPNELIPFTAPAPPALVNASGRPLRDAAATLAREVAAPTIAGIRSIHSGHPAQGLDPSRLARILRSAETGDATAYLELAEEMEEKDLHYLGLMSTRKRQVSQLPITVEAASDAAEDEADAQIVRDWLRRPTLQLELFDILDAIGKGYSATEIIWETGDQWLPGQLKWRDPRFFEYDRVTGEKLLLKGGEDGASGLPQMLRPWKFIVHTAQAKSGLPIRGGLARVAAWGYLFKNFTIKDWMTFLEVYGLPLRVGKYQNGTSEDDIRKLAQAVAQIGSDAGAVIPQSMMMEFVTSPRGTANPDMFRGMCQYLDDALSKAVLGQTSSSDAKAGGLGSGQADLHGEVRHDIESADAAQLSATLTRDLVIPMVTWNRGPRKRYPMLVIGRPEAIDLEAALDAIGKAVGFGVPVGVAYFRKVSGIPDPKPGEAVLSAPAPQGAQEGAGGAGGGDGPEKKDPLLLDALKSAKRDNPKQEVAAAAQDRRADAIDTLVEESLGDWQGLVDPLLGSFDALIAAATSMEEVRELFAIRAGDMIAGMDVDAIVRLGERAGFAAKIAGLVEMSPSQHSVAAAYDPKQPRYPKGVSAGGQFRGASGNLASSIADTPNASAGAGKNEEEYEDFGQDTEAALLQAEVSLYDAGMIDDGYQEDVSALGQYGQEAYAEINAALRAGHIPEGHEKTIEGIDAAFANMAAPKDFVVWRGVSGEHASDILSLEAGDRFLDRGFVSSSLSASVPSDFHEASGATIKVLVPKGAPFYPMGANGAARHTSEFEVLLPRNSTFLVRSSNAEGIVVEMLHEA